MSELTQALQTIRAVVRAAESAAPEIFNRHLEPVLILLENDVDHLTERVLDHIEATRAIALGE